MAARPRHIVSVVLRVLLAFALIAVYTAVYVVVTVPLIPWRALRIMTGNLYGKTVGPTVFGLAGIRPVIRNRERIDRNRPAVYVCNHASTVDMWIGMWLCPFRGCGSAKKEIVRIPIFGLAYLLSGHLLIDRGNLESAKSSMEAAARVVKKHRLSLWMWPEGTRSKDGRLQPLKKGFVHMVIATGLPVIPVVSRNADLLWPGKTFRITPGDLDMEVLPPIDTSSWTLDDVDAAAKQVHDVFVAALPERQRPA